MSATVTIPSCVSLFFLLLPFSLLTGGSLSGDLVTDEELFIRWLEIAAFLPVISFHTPPWVYGEDRVQDQNLIVFKNDLIQPQLLIPNSLPLLCTSAHSASQRLGACRIRAIDI